MYQVVKRDGKTAEFNISKISDAIKKAFEAIEKQYHPSTIDFLALKVTADFEPKIKDEKIAVEVLKKLVELGLGKSAEPVITTKGIDIEVPSMLTNSMGIYGDILHFIAGLRSAVMIVVNFVLNSFKPA